MEETWRPIKGHRDRYEVSSLGNVRSLDVTIVQPAKCGSTATHTYRGKLLKPNRHGNGYLFVNLAGKQVSVHRLVATAFIPNPMGKEQVNHKDGNKANNTVDNLEWCTASENTRHAVQNGLIDFRSERHLTAARKQIQKLIQGNKKRILQYDQNGSFIASFESIAEASRQTGINATHISLCAKGKHRHSGGYVWRYADE